MITMTEIARLTGVSQPTVSRVLNGNQAVHPDIRERVLACAREHDFQPNVMAQSLVGSKTHLIGVVLTDISNSFFADLVKYLEREARASGYSLILFNTNYDPEHEKESLDVVRRYRVDGLIAVPVNETSADWGGLIRKLGIPTVVITKKVEDMDSVYVAHEEAGAQVGEHLLEEGFEEYIFLGHTGDIKYQGFAETLRKSDPGFVRRMTVISSKQEEEVRRALEQYYSRSRKRTGIFAYNDRRAVQMLGILQRMGVKVPEQAGLVGFDNTYMCEFLYPRLSSVAQPNEEMASIAMRRLLYKIEHPEDHAAEDHPLRAKLVKRDSSVLPEGIRKTL